MEIKNIKLNYDINRDFPPKRVLVSHVNDVNTRVIELTLTDGDDVLEVGEGCSAAASIVERKTKRLINSSVSCPIDQNGNIIIPIDDLHFRDRMDINVEVTVYNSLNTKVFTLPYPLWIKVNPSILDDAEVTDESRGTVPELLEEVREIIEGDHYVLTEADKLEIAGMVNISGKEDIAHKSSSISSQSQTGDIDTYYPTVGAVRDYVNYVKNDLEDYVDDEIGAINSAKADKATTIGGYGITDAFNKSEILTQLNVKANTSDVYTKAEVNGLIPTVPTKTSDLTNDSGFLTSHQDISGKENTSNKVTAISSNSTNAQYPSALAVKTYVDTVIGGIENGTY